MIDFPIVTISLQNMQHSIMSAFTEHQLEIKEVVEEELKNVLENFSVKEEVRKAVRPLLQDVLKNALRDATHKAMYSNDVKDILQTEVHAALLSVLKEYY